MKEIITLLSEELQAAFEAAGYDPSLGKVTPSNRPDLCEYQCNGAMAGAKQYHKAPLVIAQDVAAKLSDSEALLSAEAVPPGFLNLKLNPAWLAAYVEQMRKDTDRFGAPKTEQPKRVMIDYGGPNVAKPLHVGHLRSAVIGEALKRMLRFYGNEVIGDVHLGDWGLQMGLVIIGLKERKPDLVYFDPDYEGEYPAEAPFTIGELEEIYPAASKRSKEDEAYKAKAMQATFELQHGRRGYQALLGHIMNVSVSDLKRNYSRLGVEFDLWKGESDAQPFIPDMVQKMKDDGYAYISDGALVVDVKEETDTKEVPPCMILKSDGASLYNTTDLATLVWRMRDYAPDHIIYVVDKRQELYFTQVFRCAKKTGIVPPETDLSFLGFGTMNGKDGKPFKTREGGVMRLSSLLDEVNERMLERIAEGGQMEGEEAAHTAEIVSLAALKYGDLSNQASKDYIFDVDRFTSAEGNTGPYILYTTVRIGSILNRYLESAADRAAAEAALAGSGGLLPPASESEHDLMRVLSGFGAAVSTAVLELAPHKICAYIYELADTFNHFYHETKILACEDEAQRLSWLKLLSLTRGVLLKSIDLLGFEAPEKM